MPSGLRMCQSGCPSPFTPWQVAQIKAKACWPGCGSGVATGASISGEELHPINTTSAAAETVSHTRRKSIAPSDFIRKLTVQERPMILTP